MEKFTNDASNIVSIVQWIDVLNYTNDNADEMSFHDLVVLAGISEIHRHHWNKPQIEKVLITSNGGNVREHEVSKPGLNIAREDVHPNIFTLVNNRVMG